MPCTQKGVLRMKQLMKRLGLLLMSGLLAAVRVQSGDCRTGKQVYADTADAATTQSLRRIHRTPTGRTRG